MKRHLFITFLQTRRFKHSAESATFRNYLQNIRGSELSGSDHSVTQDSAPPRGGGGDGRAGGEAPGGGVFVTKPGQGPDVSVGPWARATDHLPYL
jgi:hypothetical protein